MRKSMLTFLMLGILLPTQCTSSREKEGSREEDAYDEYDIAEPDDQQHGKVYTIEIKQMKFIPEVINVRKGDRVIWINRDIVEHDVTEQTRKAWSSSKMASTASWSMIVTKSEIYYCNLHVVMKGKIVADGEDIALVAESSMIPICR